MFKKGFIGSLATEVPSRYSRALNRLWRSNKGILEIRVLAARPEGAHTATTNWEFNLLAIPLKPGAHNEYPNL